MEDIKLRPQEIIIGYAGEYNARSIPLAFDDLKELVPDGVPVVFAKRPREGEWYPAANTTVEDGQLVWIFSAYDAAVAGIGYCHIAMVDPAGNVKATSNDMLTRVSGAQRQVDGAPDAYQSWVDALVTAGVAYAQTAVDAKRAAEEYAAAAALSAEAAETSNGNAQQAAEDAAAKAANAQASEQKAGQYAADAIAARNDAQAAVGSIADYAAAASQAAENAAEAKGGAETAQQAAEAAQWAAETALRNIENLQPSILGLVQRAESSETVVSGYARQVERDAADVRQKKTDIEGIASSVSTAVSEAVQAVQNQQATSITAVEQAGNAAAAQVEQVKDTIPADYTALSGNVNQLRDDIAELPGTINLMRKAIDSQLNITDSTVRLLSEIIEVHPGDKIVLPQEYSFRTIEYDKNSDGTYQWVATGQWRNTIEYTAVRYRRFNFKKMDDSDITNEDLNAVIETTINFPKSIEVASSADLNTLSGNVASNTAIINAIGNRVSAVEDAMLAPHNRWDGERAIPDEYYKEDGSIGSSPWVWLRMDIDISATSKITYSNVTRVGNAPKYIFMDADKVYIPGTSFKPESTNTPIEVPIPENAKYIGVSVARDDIDTFELMTYDVDIVRESELKNVVKYNQYSLNINGTTGENMIWSWWYYPIAVSFSRVRDKLYWGYTTQEGFSGIAAYDFKTKNVTRNHLKRAEVDDHNAIAIHVFDNGKILCAYAGGHNTDKQMHIRISSARECIDNFDDDIALECGGYTSYCQMYYNDGKLYIFYRVDNATWRYRYTEDDGLHWSEEVTLVSASMQYYCKFVPTTTPGLIRMCMYSNPGASDTNIRMGFFNVVSGNVYNADNSTVLGKANIDYSKFSVIIPNESGKTQRLFDVAVSAASRPMILYAPFSTDKNDDSVYKIYDGGTTAVLCNGGEALWYPKYQCGAAWIGTDKIAVGRSQAAADPIDHIELYSYSDGSATLMEEVAREAFDGKRIRNGRPIVDVNGRAFLWHRGWYNAGNYTMFCTDAKVHELN